MTDASSGSDAGYITSPGIPVSYSAGGFDTTSTQSCPSGSSIMQRSHTVKALNYVNLVLWTETFHKVWCGNNEWRDDSSHDPLVTAIIKVNAIPHLTDLGADGGWEFVGQVNSASDDYYYDGLGDGPTADDPHSAHHSYRTEHWRLCIPIKPMCGDNQYPSMNMDVFPNGSGSFFGGKDR